MVLNWYIDCSYFWSFLIRFALRARSTIMPDREGVSGVGIGAVFIFDTEAARNLVEMIIAKVGGISPTHRSDGARVLSVHYAPAVANMLIAIAHARVYEKLGQHCVALTLTVDNPVLAANQAQDIINGAGGVSKIIIDAIDDFPDGFLVFVTAPAILGQIVLEFRPSDEAASAMIAKLTTMQRAGLPVRTELEVTVVEVSPSNAV